MVLNAYRKLPMSVRYVLLGFVICLFFLVGRMSGTTTRTSSRAVQLGLKNIGELMTQAGYYTNVQVISKDQKLWDWSIPFTSSKVVFSYDGIVKAGYDFADIEVNVNARKKTISVKLPEVRLLSNEIDAGSLCIYDQDRSIFTPLELTDVNDSIIELKETSSATAIANGLYDSARANAEVLVRGFISGMYDLTEYELTIE